MLDKKLICRYSPIELNELQLKQLDIFAKLLVEWNDKFNLTSITEPEKIAKLHVIDSLYALKAVEIQRSIIDIGTGAGFPGIVMKIAMPTLELCLLEAQNKKTVFLKAVCTELGIDADIVNARAEELAHSSYRANFDYSTARAVASLSTLSEYCIPFLKTGGKFIAMKGKEIENADVAIKTLNSSIQKTVEYQLPDGEQRQLIIIEKLCETPENYPRRAATMKNKPL